MKKFLKKIYHSSPPFVINTYKQLYSVLHKLSFFYLPVHYYSGKSKYSGLVMNFIYVGFDNRTMDYCLERIFDDSEQIKKKKHIFIWNIRKYLKGKSANGDLALIELTNPKLNRIAEDHFGFILPRWVQMYVNVENSLAVIKKDNDIIRLIKRNELKIEKGNLEKDFEYFYFKMYKPHVEKRHKSSAIIEDYQIMLQEFKKNKPTLYFIVKNGSRIAGLYEMNYDAIPHLYANGVLDGSQDFLKMGVIGALYYFAFLDNNSKNVERINMGGTSPLLTDGITKFKFALGSFVSESQFLQGLKLKLIPLRNTKPVKEFFLANAFMFLNNEAIEHTFFTDDKEQDLKSIINKLQLKQKVFENVKTKVYFINEDNKLTDISN